MLANMTIFMADGRQLVSMERFEGLTKKVDCDETMSLEFVDKAAFDYAIHAWGWVNENEDDNFVMIANHDGCGPDQERVPYSITDVDYDVLKQTSVGSFRSYYVMSHGCFFTCFLTLWFCFITTPLRSYYLVL